MDSYRRTRLAGGFTLILLSGLGLLVLLRANSPEVGLPVGLASAPRGQPIGERPERLFDVPLGLVATRGAQNEPLPAASMMYLLYVPRLELYAPVIAIYNEAIQIGGQTAWQLALPPAFAVGWSADSAQVGQPGNTVLVGHNNEFGDIFRDLNTLSQGDEIYVRTNRADLHYRVSETALFEEEYRPLAERLTNARWIAPTDDERLTLITCWPYFTNTHRVVVVARPEASRPPEN